MNLSRSSSMNLDRLFEELLTSDEPEELEAELEKKLSEMFGNKAS